MTQDALERELFDDLSRVPELADNQNADDLYRALANNIWRKGDAEEGLALSWKEAEALVNRLRERTGREPLALAQSGGEGKIVRRIAEELGRLGWTHEPLDTSRHDERHIERDESPPPPDAGDRHAPVEDARAWERRAHEEAERTRRGIDPVPAATSTGAGGGKGQPGKA